MRAMSGRRITKEATVHQVHVESCGSLIASPSDQGGAIRFQVVNERNHVDHGLTGKPGNGAGADVVDPYARHQ